MMKRISLPMLLLLVALAACSNTAPAVQEEFEPQIEFEEVQPKLEVETEQEPAIEILIDNSWYCTNGNAICNGVYRVGTDLTTGRYIFTCTDAEFSAHVTVFENEEKYLRYHKASRFTTGEEWDTLAENAFSDDYIYPDETYTLNLKEGNILMIEDGRGTLILENGESPNVSDVLNGKTILVTDGVYQPGNLDIGTYILSCGQSDYSMEVVVFENRAAYDSYLASDRFTNGEEKTALELNAWSEYYIEPGEACYLHIGGEEIIRIDNGIGQMENVIMNWAE